MAQKSIRIWYEEEEAEVLGGGRHKAQKLGLVALENIPPQSDPALFVHAQPREATFPLLHYLVSKERSKEKKNVLLKISNFWEWLADFSADKHCWLKIKQPLKKNLSASAVGPALQPDSEVSLQSRDI